MALKHSYTNKKTLLSMTQVANMLGVSKQTVLRLIKSKELPYYTVSNHYRFELSDVIQCRKNRELNKNYKK